MKQSLRTSRPRSGLLIGLALRDLGWDALLTACLVASLAATLAPILILFALRSGVVESLRADLVEDPVFRSILPAETRRYPDEFFATLAEREDVAFILPSITRGASAVNASSSSAEVPLDMLPTAEGDALLEHFSAAAPPGDCVVLSQEAADALDVSQGERITLSTRRQMDGRFQSAEVDACISAVLPERADVVARVYVPLSMAVDIERFREGFAVPDRGWSGRLPLVPAVYDGAYVFTDRPVSALQRAQLASVTGFVVIEDGDENQRRSETLAALPDRVHVLRLSVVDQPADSDAIDRVRAVLAAYDPAIQPFVANLSARLGSDGLIRSVIVSDDLIAETPPSSALSEWLWIIAPRSTGLSIGDSTDLVVQLGGEPQSLPVRVAGLRESADVGIPLALASVLRSGSAREIELDLESDRLFLARESFRGFRLYARSIDDVSGLVSALSEAGISVIAQVQAIERVRVFDRGLTLLFIMIATIAGIGAIIAMLTNLYAAVERKQASIGHLRLLGLTRRAVAAFPVIQGLAMAAVSAALAFALAASAGATINTLVGPQLGFDRPVSALSAGSGAAAAALMLIASLIASVAAALRTLSIDPAEVMRHE